jgi:predicted HTH domain antitoxin
MRIPEDIDRAIQYVSKTEKIENTQSLRKLARLGFELYTALNYQNGRITLRETAELLDLSLSETIDLLSGVGVKGNIHATDVLESLNRFQH